MKNKLQNFTLIAAVIALLVAASTARAQTPCPTNYTLIGPPGSIVSMTTNGLPLLTVFVEQGQCETNIVYDEIVTDCNGSSTNQRAFIVGVGEMFDPREICHDEFDQFGNVITVCNNAYFLTAVDPFAPPLYSIINNPAGSILSMTNGLPLLIVAAEPGQCAASVSFDVVRAASCEGPASTNHVTTSVEVGAPLDPERWLTCHDEFDQFGNVVTVCYYFLLTAVDTEPPVITCPANITITATPGSCSSVVTFAPGVSDNCDASPTVICTPPSGSTFTGTTLVTCAAIDASGNTNTCTFTVTVLDSQPPAITPKPAITIKNNNHVYRTFRVADLVAGVEDTCSGLTAANCVISQVTSDEPDDVPGPGDGNTRNDIRIAAGCKSVRLMQERDGAKNGRVYQITLQVKDAAGNVGEAVARVNIPLSSNGAPAVDSGAAQTVTGCTP